MNDNKTIQFKGQVIEQHPSGVCRVIIDGKPHEKKFRFLGLAKDFISSLPVMK